LPSLLYQFQRVDRVKTRQRRAVPKHFMHRCLVVEIYEVASATHLSGELSLGLANLERDPVRLHGELKSRSCPAPGAIACRLPIILV